MSDVRIGVVVCRQNVIVDTQFNLHGGEGNIGCTGFIVTSLERRNNADCSGCKFEKSTHRIRAVRQVVLHIYPHCILTIPR